MYFSNTTFRFRPLASAVFLAVSAAEPASAAARYDFTGLGLLGGNISAARDINDQGQIVLLNSLGRKDTDPATIRSYVYQDGITREITTADGKSTLAHAINNLGEIVGEANFDADHPENRQVFIYRNGSLINTRLPASNKAVGWSLNDSGDLAGTLDSDKRVEGVLYHNNSISKTGGFTANSINNHGEVTGYVPSVSGTGGEAYLYRNGALQRLGTLGGTISDGQSINASGEVVGYSYLNLEEFHAFHYANGVMRDLGGLGGNSRAWDINDSGQIVGQSETLDNARHATLWNGGRVYDLSNLAPAGWTLMNAVSINRYGQIVGSAVHDDVEAEGYLLTLHPEWQGSGSGAWDDATRWNYAGFGSFGFAPGQPHDVLINPADNATIQGSVNARVRSLTVSGNPSHNLLFNLNDGYTASERGTRLQNAALTGAGTLEGGLQIDPTSRVQVSSGEHMRLLGGQTDNAGTIKLIGASGNLARLQTDQLLLNHGQLQLQNADADFAGGLENRGQLQISFGTNSVSGAVTNTKDGHIVISGNSETAFWGDVMLQSGSELRIARDASSVFFGQVVVRDGAMLSGTGTSYYEGGLSLGNSPALVSNSGSASFGTENLYLAEIGGLVAGQQFDQLQVAGNLSFGGVLQLMWWDNFSAKAGDKFDLFDWGSRSGNFTRIDTRFASLADGLRWDFSKLYTSGEISVAAVPLPGAFWLFGSALLTVIGRRRTR
jgi:probable HAF family extracellular repeat protein